MISASISDKSPPRVSLLEEDDLQTSVMAPVVGPALTLIKTSPYKQLAWMGADRLRVGPRD
jgi:hypothetical protein